MFFPSAFLAFASDAKRWTPTGKGNDGRTRQAACSKANVLEKTLKLFTEHLAWYISHLSFSNSKDWVATASRCSFHPSQQHARLSALEHNLFARRSSRGVDSRALIEMLCPSTGQCPGPARQTIQFSRCCKVKLLRTAEANSGDAFSNQNDASVIWRFGAGHRQISPTCSCVLTTSPKSSGRIWPAPSNPAAAPISHTPNRKSPCNMFPGVTLPNTPRPLS